VYDNEIASKEIFRKIKAFPHYMGTGQENYSYWTSIQQGVSSVDMLPRAWAVYDGCIGNSPTRNKMKVRPVAAF